MRIFLLGRFEVSVGSRVVQEDGWRLRKAASVVKLLGLARDHRLHREQVMNLLWPDLGARAAANNLHQALHVARRTIEPEATAYHYFPMRGEHLELCQEDAARVDVDAFEHSARDARRSGRPEECRAALDLYSGDLLSRDRYEESTEARREDLRRTHLVLLFELANILEDRGQLEGAVEALQEIVAQKPGHEEAHIGLMRVYARAGQRYGPSGNTSISARRSVSRINGTSAGDKLTGSAAANVLIGARAPMFSPASEARTLSSPKTESAATIRSTAEPARIAASPAPQNARSRVAPDMEQGQGHSPTNRCCQTVAPVSNTDRAHTP